MPVREVTIRGLAELQKKLKYPFLMDQAVQETMETFATRIKRQGRGLGAQRNMLTQTSRPLALRFDSTLKNPRQTGNAWVKKNTQIFNSMASRVLNKAAQRIASRFGS